MVHDHSNPMLLTSPLSVSTTGLRLTQPAVPHKSKIFTSQWAINPLVSAAAPLLSIATRLRNQTTAPQLERLYQSLCNEIKSLEYRAHAQDYRPAFISGARYFLCALVDDIILSASWGQNSHWTSRNLLSTFHYEEGSEGHFFIILDRCSEDPATYIDLLELGYLCLSSGFQGTSRHIELPLSKEVLMEKLYQLIQQERGEFFRQLSKPVEKQHSNVRKPWRLLPPLWLGIPLCVALLSSIFFHYHQQLNQLQTPLSAAIAQKGFYRE